MMVNPYSPVEQLEAIGFEAHQQARLRREVEEPSSHRATPQRRSWHPGMPAVVTRSSRYTRRERRNGSPAWACACSTGAW